MQDKITIADAPDCLNTNDKAMWVLGYEAAIEARGQCLHQIQEPAAADVLTSGAAALSEYLKTCEQHAIVPDIGGAFASAFTVGFNLSASQAALPKSEYLEGVNIPNLREALIFLGRENGVGEGEVGDKLAQYVNSVVSGVLRKKATLREAPQAAPAAVAEPQDLRAAAQAALDWLEEDGLNLTHNVRENLRAALAATPAAPAAAAPVVLPEPDAPIKEVMTLVELHRQEIIKVMDEEGSLVDVQSAQDAIESKLRALLATATGLPAQAVLDYPWRDRLLDGRELVRDQQGFAEHSELPLLDEGMKPRAFFAALGVEMKHTMADDDLSMDEYDAMSDAENWSAWTPRPPIGDAWNLVAIFDTEDGPAAWWARAQKESREAAPQAQADARDAEITWPNARDVGRLDDMSPGDSIRVGLDSDNDVYVSVCGGGGVGSVEFCNPGGSGGGQSSRTRLALIALMVAMEADNAEKPSRDWWSQHAAIAAAKGE